MIWHDMVWYDIIYDQMISYDILWYFMFTSMSLYLVWMTNTSQKGNCIIICWRNNFQDVIKQLKLHSQIESKTTKSDLEWHHNVTDVAERVSKQGTAAMASREQKANIRSIIGIVTCSFVKRVSCTDKIEKEHIKNIKSVPALCSARPYFLSSFFLI